MLGDEFVSFREGTLVNYCYYPPFTTFTEFQVVQFFSVKTAIYKPRLGHLEGVPEPDP